MPIAKIIRKTIVEANHHEINEILDYDYAEVNLTIPILSFKKNGNLVRLTLELIDKNHASETYLTSLSNGQKVRVIFFKGIRADEFKKQHDASEYFSIGSLSVTGFGIFFIITNNMEKIEPPINTNILETIQRLLTGASMQISLLGSMTGYIEVIEKIPPIASPALVKQVAGWLSILNIAISNKHLFSSKTQEWLDEFQPT